MEKASNQINNGDEVKEEEKVVRTGIVASYTGICPFRVFVESLDTAFTSLTVL